MTSEIVFMILGFAIGAFFGKWCGYEKCEIEHRMERLRGGQGVYPPAWIQKPPPPPPPPK